ncbi:MAG TPA: class I SAM-dependent methyltransferase [Kofleriaceae bacterium]|jgi:O-methyltransferase involved in polyketide biosynthesis|nr:class I SAM-dependent methyltransferase [Kofleriaceae bacterium]
MARAHPETISPTAHYTGYVWYAHGQSHDAFATRTGRVLYQALRGANVAAHAVGLPSMEGMLLARHRLIDLRLTNAIDAGEISQVVEVACGLSPRGWRFRSKYGDAITYVEADLPGMLKNKQRIIAQLGGETAHHYTAEIDALADDGPTSIDSVCAKLDPSRGTAIITEGLINYFDHDTMLGIWRRLGNALRKFPRSLYLSDVVLRGDNRGPIATGFSWLLAAFVRGKTHLHFDTIHEAEAALESVGLLGVLLDPREFSYELPDLEKAGAGRVRIIEAMAKA